MTNQQTEPVVISGNHPIQVLPLPYGGEGVELIVEGKMGTWVLDFAAPTDSKFRPGTYENLGRYPFQGYFTPGVEVRTPRGTYTKPQGSFKVLEMEKNAEGQIDSLTLNFNIEGEDGEVLEGAIRYKSDTAINIGSPYDESDPF